MKIDGKSFQVKSIKLKADGTIETNINDACESGQCIKNGVACAFQDDLKRRNVLIRLIVYECDDRKVV